MKIIDILNKKANGELEDGFKFAYGDTIYTYKKEGDTISKASGKYIGGDYYIENILNKEVLLFKDNNVEESKDIEELHILDKGESNDVLYEYCSKLMIKQNELVRAVNKLRKKEEEK